MYEKIYDFCKVRNIGGVYKNDPETPTPRVQFLMDLLDSEGVEYELDRYNSKGGWRGTQSGSGIPCYNIVMKGTSNRMVRSNKCRH